MKKFLLNLLVFTVFISLVAVCLDVIISLGLRKYERGHFVVLNQIMLHDSINADIIISGNSRGSCSYDPRIFDTALNVKSFNLSASGQNYGTMNLRENQYIKRNKPPKLLIENIDYTTLNTTIGGFEREQYFPYILDKSLHSALLTGSLTKVELYVPLWRYRGDYKMIFYALMEFFKIKHFKRENYGGYIISNNPAEWEWNPKQFNEIVASGKNINCLYSAAALDLMKQTLQQHVKRGTKVLLVYAPIYSKLKEYIPCNDSVVALFRSLADEKNIFMLDFTDQYYNSDTTCFLNANHANPKGAALFSNQLVNAIDSLGVLK